MKAQLIDSARITAAVEAQRKARALEAMRKIADAKSKS